MEFEEFARVQIPGLVRFATALSADRGLAEELVQDALIRVHARWATVARLDSPEAYVRRAVVNAYLSWRRRWARVIPRAVLPETDRSIRDHAEQLADRSELAGELARLPAQQRAVLVLRYYAGMSDPEIAQTLGCRPATVRSYASRALATLRVELTHPEPEAIRSHHAY